MRKILATILSVCALTAFAMPKTALSSALADKALSQEISAPMLLNDTAATAISDQATKAASQTKLLSPNTYEQHLALSSPTDVAVSANFTAIADGNNIYVYDRIDGVYRKYVHGSDSPQYKVTKLQFDSEENLYFLDAATALYVLDPLRLDEQDVTATKTELVCSTFAINGKNLYYTNTSGNKSQISSAPLNNLQFSASTTHVQNLTLTPALAFYKNELYYTNSGQYLNKIGTSSGSKETFVTAFEQELLSLSIVDGKVYCVTADEAFYKYDLNALTEAKQSNEVKPLDKKTGGYTALTMQGDYAYLIKKKCILQYSLKKSAFTDYEIGSASASTQRLNNAKDVTLAKDKLLIADVGNKRISVYDLKENKFLQPLSTNFSALHIAADSETALFANKTEAILYNLSADNYGEQLATSQRLDGNLVGVANVYGKYYCVTDKNRFYTLAKNTETSAWEWTTAQKKSTLVPSLLTADIYGNLFVACGESVYMYNEANFTTTTVSSKAVLTELPANTTKLSADYRSNLYALVGSTLHQFNAPTKKNGTYSAGSSYDLNEPLVYGSNGAAQSFTLSVEDNAAYILYKGNFLAVTEKLQLPTVKNIPVEKIDEDIFNDKQTNFTVVKTNANALLVAFNINALQGAQTFPYLSHQRHSESLTALKMGKTDVYDLIAVYNEKKAQYDTYLVYSDSCTEYKTDGYTVTYPKDGQKIGYISSNAALYKIPFASTLFATSDIQRGESVTLLGEITKLDRPYYYVSYKNAKGKTVTGYLPQVYITEANGNMQSETLLLGGTENHTDAYGRLAYILLGTAVICILVDYLILRKPKEDDEE